MRHRKGFSIWQAVVLGVIAIIAVAILMPAVSYCGPSAWQMQNSTQVRGVHSGMLLYAQGNNTYFPGLTSDGSVLSRADATVGRRMQTLLINNYFTGEYIISPSEAKKPWTQGTVTKEMFSYAMLNLTDSALRRSSTWRHSIDAGATVLDDRTIARRIDEWRDTINSEAVVVGDRNSGSDSGGNVHSIHQKVPLGQWRGSVGWNDNHVTWETTHETSINTKYGQGAPVTDDNLFADDNDDAGAGGNDALLEYTSD